MIKMKKKSLKLIYDKIKLKEYCTKKSSAIEEREPGSRSETRVSGR